MGLYDRYWYRENDKESSDKYIYDKNNQKISKENAEKIKKMVRDEPENINEKENQEFYEKNEPPKVDSQYKTDFIGKSTEQFDYTAWKIDEFIKNMDNKNNNKTFYEKIYYLMEVIHNNIKYDEQLKDFTERKDSNGGIFKGFYDYKNSADEVFKDKKGTCVGFSNSLKKLCDESRIKCKVFYYHNNNKNFHHQLNIVFDDDIKYYVDPTWGFIVQDIEVLKKIYRGEIPNPRTNQSINYSDNGSNSETYYPTETKISKKYIIWDKILNGLLKASYVLLVLLIVLIICLVIFRK